MARLARLLQRDRGVHPAVLHHVMRSLRRVHCHDERRQDHQEAARRRRGVQRRMRIHAALMSQLRKSSSVVSQSFQSFVAIALVINSPDESSGCNRRVTSWQLLTTKRVPATSALGLSSLLLSLRHE